MSNEKKDTKGAAEKSEAAPAAAGAPDTAALLAKLQGDINDLRKKNLDQAEYAKELEAELRKRDAGDDDDASPQVMIKALVDGQVALSKAVAELAKAQASAAEPEVLRHADTLVDGQVPLDPKYKGKRKYKLTEAIFRKGEYLLAGKTIDAEDEKPSRTWELVDDSAPTPKASAPAASPVDVQT